MKIKCQQSYIDHETKRPIRVCNQPAKWIEENEETGEKVFLCDKHHKSGFMQFGWHSKRIE